MVATYGGDKEALALLFKAIDKDNDSYISCVDVIRYCSATLEKADQVSFEMIKNTVQGIFNDMNRSDPFDVCSEEEFIDYAEKNPECVFATWSRLLQWKFLSNSKGTPSDTPKVYKSNSRREILRARTHDPRPNLLEDYKKTSEGKSDRRILSVISPRKDSKSKLLVPGQTDSDIEDKYPKKQKRNSHTRSLFKPTIINSDNPPPPMNIPPPPPEFTLEKIDTDDAIIALETFRDPIPPTTLDPYDRKSKKSFKNIISRSKVDLSRPKSAYDIRKTEIQSHKEGDFVNRSRSSEDLFS